MATTYHPASREASFPLFRLSCRAERQHGPTTVFTSHRRCVISGQGFTQQKQTPDQTAVHSDMVSRATTRPRRHPLKINFLGKIQKMVHRRHCPATFDFQEDQSVPVAVYPACLLVGAELRSIPNWLEAPHPHRLSFCAGTQTEQ